MRWGLGPVFFYECLTNSRRWQTYALRSIGVTALLAAMIMIAISPRTQFYGSSWRGYAQLGESYYYAMIGVELALVMLAAPAAAAGAICLDRARGTLAHMLVTDLSDLEIVLGKLAARLMPVLGLVACSWPVMAICSLLGGIDPIALILAFAIIVAMAVLGCTIALTLSVWARKTHEVIISTYIVWVLALLIWPIWYGLSIVAWVGGPPFETLLANPFYVAFAPYAQPGRLVSEDYAGFFGVTLGASAVLTLLAVWRTRPVACRGSRDTSRRPRLGLIGRLIRGLPSLSLDRNPVLWRECHRSRPTPWMTAILTLLMGTTGFLCIVGAVALSSFGPLSGPRLICAVAGLFGYFFHVAFGLLMLSAIAPTSMAEERQRGSLDILATTALSTRSIVIGKWLGIFRLAVLMATGPGLMVLAMAITRSLPFHAVGVVIATILAHGALIASIGIALAVWIRRQSRAIAVSVGVFVLINAAWPLFARIAFHDGPGDFSRDLACLSPAMLLGRHVDSIIIGGSQFEGEILWCGTFWAVEVFILAMGLLWLTVRTFDDCFDRIPDQPRRLPVLAIVAITVVAMLGGASLVWAIDLWVEGFPSSPRYPPDGLILAYSLATTIGLLLIAALSTTSISTRRRRGTIARNEIQTLPNSDESVLRDVGVSPGHWESIWDARMRIRPWRFVLGRWWKSFRLVLLVALGPGLLAMTLATVPNAPRYTRNLTAEVPLERRLGLAALLFVTILVHGSAGVSTGLALATSIRWTRRTVVAIAGLTLFVVYIVPYGLFVFQGRYLPYITVLNIGMTADSLLEPLVWRWSFHSSDILWTAMFWDVVVGVFSAVMLWFAIRMWQRRARGLSDDHPALEQNGEAESVDVEPALMID